MSRTQAMLTEIWGALGGPDRMTDKLFEVGEGSISSSFAITDFAEATTAAAGLALAEFVQSRGGGFPGVCTDRRLASMWFAKSIRPIGWSLRDPWDPIAGNYAARDGWVRLHTNAPHHRAAAMSVLGVDPDRVAVSEAVARWFSQDLENAVVEANGCAAKMRTLEEWGAHEQGSAVQSEALVAWAANGSRKLRDFGSRGRPLAGLRVLDLTRVLAGPVATRFLAGYGADVLRIDPPFWDEPAVLPEVTPGKTRARLDLRVGPDRETFARLLSQADVMVHGYRSDALERMGFGAAARSRIAPGLIDVALDAYGWTGPWSRRRGFDTVVQMSAGIAANEMAFLRSEKPEQMPVQALDYGTGYMAAAAVLRGLTMQAGDGLGRSARLSLARTAACLAAYPSSQQGELAGEREDDLDAAVEETHWGPARRLKPPVRITGCDMRFDRSAGPLGDGAPAFVSV